MRLAAALQHELKHLDRLEQRMRRWIDLDRWQTGDAELYAVAVTLEHYDTGAEALFERIAREFEGLPPGGDRWHKDLLSAMGMPIPGLRPALLSEPALRPLARLFGFPHFTRHAYAMDLDPEQLQPLAHALLDLHRVLRQDIQRFIEALLGATEG